MFRRLLPFLLIPFLASCANYHVARQCEEENPLPIAYHVASGLGILGPMLYHNDVSPIFDARNACFAARKVSSAN